MLATETLSDLLTRPDVYGHYETAVGDTPTQLTLSPVVSGRYVRVHLTASDYLQLAEVQVYGE